MTTLNDIQTIDYQRNWKPEFQAEYRFGGLGLLPKPICQWIEGEFRNSEHQAFVFDLAAHVIQMGGQAVTSQQLLRKFRTAPKRTTTLSKLTTRCLFLFERSGYRHGSSHNYARSYRLKDEHLQHFASAPLFKTWRDFKKRQPYRHVAKAFDEAAFSQHARKNGSVVLCPDGFIEAMARLSQRKFKFDRAASLADPIANKQAIAFPPGEFSTSYYLQKSGRIGTKEPNLQGLKRHLRQFIKPPEGYCHLYFDYSSQEPRLLAYFSGDPLMREIFAENKFYEMLQGKLELRDRDMSKAAFNSIIYGSGALSLAQRMFDATIVDGGQISHAQQIIDCLKRKFPVATEWCNQEAERIIRQDYAQTVGGTIRTDFERNRNGKIAADQARRAGVNHLLQGTGADLMRQLIVNLDRELEPLGAYPILPVHDGVLVEAPLERKDEVRETVLRLMQNEVPNQLLPGIQLPVKCIDGWYETPTMTDGIWRTPPEELYPLWVWEVS